MSTTLRILPEGRDDTTVKCHQFDCNTRTRAIPVSIYWSVVKSVICETRRYRGLWHPTSSSCGGLRGPFKAPDMWGEFI